MNPTRYTSRLFLSLFAFLLCLPAATTALDQEPVVRTAQLQQVKPDLPMSLVFPEFFHTWGMQRGGPVHLRIFLGRSTRFDNPQGLAVTVLDSWDDPEDKSDDDEVTVYGINSGRGEIIYNTSMFSLDLYGSTGRGDEQFMEPHGIDADPSGNLVVADTGNNRVAVLFNNGSILIHHHYIYTVAPGDTLREPYDVVLTPDDGVWVSDTGNHRLVHFSLEGEVRDSIDLKGIVDKPGAIAISHPEQRWSYYRTWSIFLASRAGDTLLKLDREGNILAQVISTTAGQEKMGICYITTDFFSNIWATDRESHSIHKFDRDLNYLVTFGSEGSKDRQFKSPRGIAIWRRFGQTFIAEERSAQYYWIGADAYDVEATQIDNRLKLSFKLNEYSYVTVRVRYIGGGVQELYRRRYRRVGEREEDLELEQDKLLSWVEVVVEPTYSSYTYREKVFHLRFSRE